jgi:valyl-tRNA synthetase
LYDKNSPLFENNNGEFIPMSMRPQAHDIIRTWAFDTIVKTWMHHGIAPWKDIVISGHVLSDKKEKLSKKEGNTMDPENLLQKYPADAIRYWTASAKLGQDTMFSEEQLAIGQKLITKLWNAFRFAQPHLENFTTPDRLPETLGAANQWLLHTASICFDKYQHYFEQQEPSLALNCVEQFFWNDYCDNYVELIKNQVFNPHEYTDDEVYATRWTLYHVGLRILQLYAPYIPHVTEILYQQLYRSTEKATSIHQSRYAAAQTPYVFTEQAEAMNIVIALTATIRKLKSEQQLSLKTPLAAINVFALNQTTLDTIAQHEQLIRGVTQAAAIVYNNSKSDASRLEKTDESWHAHVLVD